MSLDAGYSISAIESWEAKQPRPTLLDVANALVQRYALPVAVAAFLIRRYLANRKKASGVKSDAKVKVEQAKSPQEIRKPRREYKVKREQEGPLLVRSDDEGVEVQPHDNVMEAYDEMEVEKAGAAAADGVRSKDMLQMLKQMGYRLVMPEGGNGQIFMVPPGGQIPGGQAIAEGDEEGYDEDEGYDEPDEEDYEEE